MAALPFFGSSSSAGPSSSAAVPSAAAGPDMLQLFVRAREPKKPCRCIRCPSTTTGLAAAGVQHLATVEVAGRLPSQGFARMHQLLEKLVETLAPAGSTGSGNSPSGDDNDASLPTASREPIMHAIDAEINEHRAEARRHVPPGTPVSPCHCMACTLRPNSALRLCGTLLHSNDVAIINLAFRVVQFVLRARADCCTPVVLFSETSGALVLCGGDAYRWLYDSVMDSLTPEGVAVAALLTLRLSYDAKTHPLLWQHPSKKQTLLEMAARSPSPDLLLCLMPALHLSRLHSSGAFQAVSMASYKALHAMALNGRHELLGLLLKMGTISAPHVSLLLETALQKKGKQPLTELVAAEMVVYVGPLGAEAASLLKVAAGHSSAAVVGMLLDVSTQEQKGGVALDLIGLALAEACDCSNDEAMRLLLERWVGRCSAAQAQPLVRAFAAHGDAERVGRLLCTGKQAMVQMDSSQRSALAKTGLAHAAGAADRRTAVLRTLLAAGADAKSESGEAALRNAAREGHSEAMELILSMGSNVNAVDGEGKTVLCVAAASGCVAAVRCLLHHGAQVRQRCPDGREPLDFAGDESVRSIILAEVEKLRMGLLDELLAEEEPAAKSGKKGKKAKKTDSKARAAEAAAAEAEAAAQAAAAAQAEAAAAQAEAAAAAVKRAAGGRRAGSAGNGVHGEGPQREAANGAPVWASAEGGGVADEPAAAEDGAGDGKKKKKKKKGGAGTEAGVVGAPASGQAAAPARAAPPPPPPPPPVAVSREAVPSNPNEGKGCGGGAAGAELFDAAVSLLSVGDGIGQRSPRPVRLSVLTSALYESSAAYKEAIKGAGGLRAWLERHPEAFELSWGGPSGQDQVKLRPPQPPDALPPPLPPARSRSRASEVAAQAAEELAREAAARALAEEGLPPPLPPPRRGPSMPKTPRDDPGLEGLPPPLPPPPAAARLGSFGGSVGGSGTGFGGLLGELGGTVVTHEQCLPAPLARCSSSGRFGAIGSAAHAGPIGPADGAQIPNMNASFESLLADEEEASLAGAAEADPITIEKKIRAIQKKLRRVQEMEERNTQALPLDAGQMELLRSKPKLQRSLQLLLEQWAVLEPKIIQQQARRMAALANSECAVCLDEYSADAQAIRTSCCGYHFHKSCLQQCIESKGHCPICFADKVQCRVVEQRVRSAAAL